jgi:hypothetical protein
VKEFLEAIGAKELVNSARVGQRRKPSDAISDGATSLVKGGTNWQDNSDLIERAKEHGFFYTGRYLPYDPKLKQYARELRKNMTKAERKLWYDFLKNSSQFLLSRSKACN